MVKVEGGKQQNMARGIVFSDLHRRLERQRKRFFPSLVHFPKGCPQLGLWAEAVMLRLSAALSHGWQIPGCHQPPPAATSGAQWHRWEWCQDLSTGPLIMPAYFKNI